MNRRTVSSNPTPNTDVLIAGDERDQKCGDAHQQQCDHQCGLSPETVAIMAEDRRADRPRQKTYRVNTKGFQRADKRIGARKIQSGKHQASHGAV